LERAIAVHVHDRRGGPWGERARNVELHRGIWSAVSLALSS
jgi:hypothetical protein